MSDSSALVLSIVGLAFLVLFFRAFFRWLDVREHAKIWRPQGSAQSVRQQVKPDRRTSA